MRLTLRTLLAWLDDTLPPSEVRQIGQQVAESPLAGELVERIHKVTRQRRLTVPNGSGPDGVDANIVSGYLGDEISPEIVAEYEKRCLTSDVHLAEVASVHQILSLLGQKAKVPPEAKQRMYHLVRGREATAPPTPRPASSTRKREPQVASSWTPEPLKPRSLVERFGPLAAVAALILVLCWSAYLSVGPTPPKAKTSAPELAKADPKVPVAAPPAEAKGDREPDKIADKPGPKPEDKPAPEQPTGDKPELSATPDTEVAPLPAGAAGVVGQGTFLLLRYNADTRAWEQLVAGAALRDGDRIVNLPSSMSPVRVGAASLTLIGDTELKVLSAAASSSRFELTRGKVRIQGGSAKESITVPFDSGSVTLAVPANGVVGLQRINRRAPGTAAPSPPVLGIAAIQEPIAIEAGGATANVDAGSATVFHAPATLEMPVALDPVPEWMTETAPTAAAQEREKALARSLKPNLPPLVGLLEALESADESVRADAITAIGAVGPKEIIVTTMSTKDNPASRKAAIAVLRDIARRDAESAKTLRGQLDATGGSKEWADDAEAMLVGYSAREAADKAIALKLIGLLKHMDVGMRQLAIDMLQAISKRGDTLGYDPDKPTDEAIKAWSDLVDRDELRSPATSKAR